MHYLIRCKSAVLTGAEKIGSVSGRDVRHLCPGPSRSLVKMAHIPGGVSAVLHGVYFPGFPVWRSACLNSLCNVNYNLTGGVFVPVVSWIFSILPDVNLTMKTLQS